MVLSRTHFCSHWSQRIGFIWSIFGAHNQVVYHFIIRVLISALVLFAPFQYAFSYLVIYLFLSLICEELDRPRRGEEDEKSDVEEIEKEAAERRKIRGKFLQSDCAYISLKSCELWVAKLFFLLLKEINHALIIICDIWNCTRWGANPQIRCYFSWQITKEQAWQSTWNILISFWIKCLSRGKEIFSEKVVWLCPASWNIFHFFLTSNHIFILSFQISRKNFKLDGEESD